MTDEQVLQAIRAIAKELKGDSAAAAGHLEGQPSISTVLMVQNRQTGQLMVLPYDDETQGVSINVTSAGSKRSLLGAGVLGTSSTTIYTATGSVTDVSVYVANVDTALRTFQLCRVVSGGSIADANSLRKDAPLYRGGSDEIHHLGLESGDTIRGLCDSASKVNVMVFGVVV